MTKLNLACGKEYLEGWINIDDCSMWPDALVDKQANILDLEWEENSVDGIRLSHFVMYTRPKELLKLVKKLHGWIKVGGILEIETIDFERVAKIALMYQDGDFVNRGLVNIFGNEETGPHKWGWSKYDLSLLIESAGFSEHRITEGHKKPERDFKIICTKS